MSTVSTDHSSVGLSLEHSTTSSTTSNNGRSPTWRDNESINTYNPSFLTSANESRIQILDIEESQASKNPFFARLHDCMRQCRMQIIAVCLRPFSSWKVRTEYRKVAMYKCRYMALLHSLIHVIPLGGALTLIVLFWTKYWLGSTFRGTTTLQFVAKFHELLMQASITEISLCFIRILITEHYVPLGVLSGAAQTRQISYLWSLDFWATFKARGFFGWQKMLFTFSLPLLILLTALVGPSAAVLMIPRPGTTHQNATETLFSFHTMFSPTTILKPDGGYIVGHNPIEKDFMNLKELKDLTGWNTLPGTTTRYSTISYLYENQFEGFTHRRRIDVLKASEDWARGYEDLNRTSNAVTIPTRLSIETLLKFASVPLNEPTVKSTVTNESSSIWSVKMSQPVVQVNCKSSYYSSNFFHPHNIVPYMRDDRSDGYLFDHKELEDILWRSDRANETTERSMIAEWLPIWLQSPEAGSSSQIFMFARKEYSLTQDYLDNITSWPEKWFVETRVKICTIQAYSRESVVTLSWNDAYVDSITVKTNSLEGWDMTHHENMSPIVFDMTDNSYFRSINFSQDFFPNEIGQEDNFGLSVACVFADALSRVPNPTYMSQVKTPDKVVPYIYSQHFSGYGYGNTTTSDLLALAILTIYCIIVIGYLTYTLITGTTSTAWNSPIELVTLALQSGKPDHLGHTSVGIDLIETFRESVGIRVNQQDQIELVFAHDRDIEARGLRKIERNKEY